MEKFKNFEQKLETTITNFKRTQIRGKPAPINFETDNLNGKIAELRKRYRGKIEIRKDFGGSRSNKKYAHYTIKFQEKPFQLGITINESGLCEYFNDFRPISSRTYQNLAEMITAIDTIVKKVIDSEGGQGAEI